MLAAIPTVAFVNDPPSSAIDPSFRELVTDPLIGSQNAFTLRFDNAGSGDGDVGYSPYVDLFVPTTGVDGVYPGTPAANAYDGIDFVSATYLGVALKSTTVTLTDDPAGVAHPFAKDSSGNPLRIKLADHPGFKKGDKLVVLELPLGSYTPSQPPVDIVVTTSVSNKADVDVPLSVVAQGGFRYGGDPLDNPTTDPTIVGATSSQAFTPALFHVTKENLAPEYETATGPNFHQHFRIRVDVADGQTLTDLRLKDVLPSTLQFVGATVTGGGSVTNELTPSTSVPGGTLQRLLSTVVGTSSASDAVMDIEYFVPVRDASSAPVLSATTGDDVTIPNSAEASNASWTPIDTRDPVVSPIAPVTVPTTGPLGVWDPKAEHPLVAKSIATQKSVAGTATPGSLLTYTINFQVSDYFAFNNLVLTDLLGDGQRLEGTPTLSVHDGHTVAGTTSGTFNTANYTTTLNKPGQNGKDEIVFRISDELVGRGFSNGRLVGGAIPIGGTGSPLSPQPAAFSPGTTGTITFTARVQDTFDGTVATGNQQLVPNDLLDNTATIAGDILSNADLATKLGDESDGTYAWTRVPQSTFSKSVYAKNGSTAGQPLPATTLVTAGDTITYRLRYTLPNSSTEALKLTDYLPLPLFNVTDTGTAITGFDAAASGTGNAPVAGKWTYNTGDTYHTINPVKPTVANASGPNSVTFDFGTFDDTQNRSSVIDILFTVTASNRPFADGLKLANRAATSTTNSNLDAENNEAIAEVTSSEPDLRITKGIVATDNPNGVFAPATKGPVTFSTPTGAANAATRFTGTINSTNLAANPVNSNLSEVDGNDFVTYCIVVENRGSGRYGAFDTVIQDRPPAGVAIPGVGTQGINLRVTDGAGNPLPFTQIGAGLFEGGIKLTDPSATQGAIRRGVNDAGATVTDGSNVVVITYDMKLLENNVLAKLRNTGAVTEYAATEGGPDFTGPGEISDSAVITIATENLLDKQLVSTEFVNATNALNEAVIGELVTYRVTVTVPEAIMPNAVLSDTLDSRLAFVDMVGVTTSTGVSITGSTTPAVTNSGGKLTFNLGTITNSDRDNATKETITFEYRAVVLNKANAQGGDQVRNRAALTFDGLATPRVKQAEAVTIIEPRVNVTKTAAFDDGNPTGDADDPLTYTIVLANPAGQPASTADAFDVTFSDALPKKAGGSLIVGNGGPAPTFTVVDSLGLVTAASFELVGDDTIGYTLRTKAGVTFDMPVGSRTITIEVKGKTPSSGGGLVTPGDVISNTATALWSSLDGDVSTPRSTYNTDSVERTGSGSPSYNDYRGSSSADLRITGVGLDKTVVATSESATSDPNKVVVGEIVRYRLVAVIPETTTNSFKLEDQLPAGLKFLNDGTAKIALVSNGGGITSTTIGAGASVTGSAAVSPSFVIPVGAILGGPTFGDGTDVTFDLGRVVNSDSDPDEELAVIEFNAIVTNVATNQIGTTLLNTVNFLKDSIASGTSSTAVRVAEPEIQSFQKLVVDTDDTTPVSGPFDAGDTIRYRVDVVTKAGGDNAIAYDTRVLDTLPATESLVPGSIRVFRNGSLIGSGFSDASASGEIDVTIAQIAPGDEVRVFYDVVLSRAVTAGGTVTNTAGLTYTSLPGGGTPSNPTGSTVPGGTGAADGERNGAGGPLNDYAATTTATIDIKAPELQKKIEKTSPVETQSNQFDPDLTDFTVGEVVTYRLRATLPEGTTPSLVLSDLLPSNRMKFYSSGGSYQARVVSIGGNITGSSLAVGAPGVVNAGAGTVTFDFGTVVNAPDNVGNGDDEIVVEITTQVTKDAANVAGTTIVNTGRLGYTVGESPATITDTVTSDIVEPKLVTTKEIVVGGSTTDSLTADTGDTVTFRVTVRHDASSTGPAFGIRIADTLPTGLELVAGSVRVVSHPNYPSSFYDQPVVTTNVGGNPNAFSVLIDYLDKPGNGFALGGDLNEAVIEYQAKVTPALAGGSTITNTARVSYDSLYSDVPDSNAEKRNYTTSDPTAVTTRVVDLSVTKTDRQLTYVPGLPITYTITVSNLGAGIVRGATVADTLPAVIQGATWTVAYAGTGSTGPASGTGNINASIDLAVGGTATFTVKGTVASTATGNLVNTATVTPPGNTGDVTPGNNTATDTDTPDPQVDLRVTKTDHRTTYSAGQSLTYEIVVTNDGPSFARSVRVRDPLPAQLENATWTASYTGTGSTGPAKGTGSIMSLVNLAAGGTATFRVTAKAKLSANDTITNVVNVLPAPGTTDKTPNNNRAVDRDRFEPRVDLAVTKTDGREVFQPGTNATYTIVVTNAGPGSAVNARVSDPLPAGVDSATWTATYSPSSSGPASGSGAIDALVTLLPGGSAIFTFVAAVSPTANGKLSNTASVTAPEGSVDTDPSNNSATDVDKLPAVVLGPDVGCDSAPLVTILDPFTGAVRKQFLAYEEGFRGGVSATLVDLDGNGVDEVVTGPGTGRLGEVRVFDQQGNRLTQYDPILPFGGSYLGGVNVAGGDINGDGYGDLVVSMARGAGDVKVFESRPSGSPKLVENAAKAFRPFAKGFQGGSTVAVADVGSFSNGATTSATVPDRRGEIVVGSGPGMSPSVLVYDVSGTPTVIDRISPFTAALRSGVSVNAGRYNADAIDDIFVSGGRDAGSVTEVYDGTVAAADNAKLASPAAFASLARPNAPVFAAGVDLTGDNRTDQIFAAQGFGGAKQGIRRVASDGALLPLLTQPADLYRVAASKPRIDASLVTTSTGLQYRDVKVGTGAVAAAGQKVKVHYVGSLQNGTVFDSSRDRRGGNPFEFTLGTGAVIKGWDEGVAGMKVGGRRTLIIPANLAYGGSAQPGIPANSPLVFDVELISVG